jgi:ring-1,2-phenylacetyl-CoA epoxidase subunit PaaC
MQLAITTNMAVNADAGLPDKAAYLLHLADTMLILSQRNAAWCGHGPILEQDIALTNITLDQLGQARHLYQYAAALMGNGATEDSLAYLRTERAFKNLLIAEQPNGHWGQTVLKQFFVSVYLLLLYRQLEKNVDQQIASIAAKSLKEVTYHVKWSSEWVIRLGDGTRESNTRMINALDGLWPFTGEFFVPANYEATVITAVELPDIELQWTKKVQAVLEEATLPLPSKGYMHSGGKNGIHTEHLGYILAEMQYLQRCYPGAQW